MTSRSGTGHTAPFSEIFSTVSSDTHGSVEVDRIALQRSTELSGMPALRPRRLANSRWIHRSVRASKSGSMIFSWMTIWL